MRRKLLYGLGAALVVLVIVLWYVATRLAPVATGYVAKTMCSAVFVSGREEGDVRAKDLVNLTYVATGVDAEERVVTATIYGVAERKAVWRPGLGCALAIGVEPKSLREQALQRPVAELADAPWPRGNAPDDRPDPEGLDRAALDAAVDAAFAEPEPERPKWARAVVVVYGDRILAERYAEGIDADMPLLGWSMSKSVTNALIGILVQRGELQRDAPPGLPEWEGTDDPRRDVTLDQMLRMSSGLAFEETYDARSDVTTMLFTVHDAAAVAIDKPLAETPGSRMTYSSGTSNILCRVIRDRFDDIGAYHRFPHEALFARIGMTTAVFETDPSGTFVGSSFAYASARDWARFGLLYLDEGAWNGEQILPDGWVEYSATPSRTAPRGEYGAHFWTNGGQQRLPSLPADTFYASGFEGQVVAIVPSRDAVIVRLGMTHDREAWDLDAFAAPILAALP